MKVQRDLASCDKEQKLAFYFCSFIGWLLEQSVFQLPRIAWFAFYMHVLLCLCILHILNACVCVCVCVCVRVCVCLPVKEGDRNMSIAL